MSSLILIVISGVLVNNLVMSQFLGICPFLGVSKKTETAFGMGMAVTFVMAIASLITYLIQHYLLEPLSLEYMQTIAFILVIAVLVQTVEMVLKKLSRSLYQALGVYLPLITTNCAVLVVAISNTTAIDGGYNLIQSVVNGISGALGFTLAMVAFAAIREKLAMNNMPKWMDGFPGALIAAGLMAVAFQGFAGLI
ncbi:MAG TPA: electron transport complex subunit RsxA [Candidatus Limiplasma sp.]|nr:electron transport complex subunit RsxA [Candidatus Limiplasma sp.]